VDGVYMYVSERCRFTKMWFPGKRDPNHASCGKVISEVRLYRFKDDTEGALPTKLCSFSKDTINSLDPLTKLAVLEFDFAPPNPWLDTGATAKIRA